MKTYLTSLLVLAGTAIWAQESRVLHDPSPSVIPFVLPLIIMGFVFIFPIAFIFKKAGYSPWLVLLCFIPIAGIPICLYILAFGSWPKDRVK